MVNRLREQLIAGVRLPQDELSIAARATASRRLPRYLLDHSIRSYIWGAAIAAREGWTFDARVLWVAALFHDLGLTRVSRNTRCFEFQGAEAARRVARALGLGAAGADLVGRAIELHMAQDVTLSDGVECVLLDRATAIDVRGVGMDTMATLAPTVFAALPRGSFDRRFRAAIRREVDLRSGCQSQRLLPFLEG